MVQSLHLQESLFLWRPFDWKKFEDRFLFSNIELLEERCVLVQWSDGTLHHLLPVLHKTRKRISMAWRVCGSQSVSRSEVLSRLWLKTSTVSLFPVLFDAGFSVLCEVSTLRWPKSFPHILSGVRRIIFHNGKKKDFGKIQPGIYHFPCL